MLIFYGPTDLALLSVKDIRKLLVEQPQCIYECARRLGYYTIYFDKIF